MQIHDAEPKLRSQPLAEAETLTCTAGDPHLQGWEKVTPSQELL